MTIAATKSMNINIDIFVFVRTSTQAAIAEEMVIAINEKNVIKVELNNA